MDNDNFLALIKIENDDEPANKKKEKNQRAVLITDTPDLAKLTRAKARQLKKDHIPKVPVPVPEEKLEFVSLIQDEFHSDEDDEEYIFREEDFISDEDHNTSISDLDSQPPTPKSPQNLIRTDIDNSTNLLSPDGCFKMPRSINDKKSNDLRIATRTRSKLCLEKTTIEDLQSEFIPPDVETGEIQHFDTSDIWTEFLNEFSRPLNSNFIGEDDDVNDPEYVGNENVPLDAEELKNVNISKKELNDLVASIFEDLLAGGATLETIEVAEPNNTKLNALKPTVQTSVTALNEKNSKQKQKIVEKNQKTISDQVHSSAISDNTISSSNVMEVDCKFNPNAMSTPNNRNFKVSKNDNSNLSTRKHVKINKKSNSLKFKTTRNEISKKTEKREFRSARRCIYNDYIDTFEALKFIPPTKPTYSTQNTGFTEFQYQILQQQLRIHVQFIAQNFIQTYCHPELWKLAHKYKEMMLELTNRAKDNATYNAWNLHEAQKLINEWEAELSEDTIENRNLMQSIYKQISKSKRYPREVAKFPERMRKRIVESSVFMYPEYLPTRSFRFVPSKHTWYDIAPSESLLIAMGLENHISKMCDEKLSHKAIPFVTACGRIAEDTVLGKTKVHIRRHIKDMLKIPYYNPIKYYFEHRCAPPIQHNLICFESGIVLPPKMRQMDIPLIWREPIHYQWSVASVAANIPAYGKYSKAVFEAIGESISLIDSQNVRFSDHIDDSSTITTTKPVSSDAAERKRKKCSSKSSRSRKFGFEQNSTIMEKEHTFTSDIMPSVCETHEKIHSNPGSIQYPVKLESISLNVTQTAYCTDILSNPVSSSQIADPVDNTLCSAENSPLTSQIRSFEHTKSNCVDQESLNFMQTSSVLQSILGDEKQRKITDYFPTQDKSLRLREQINSIDSCLHSQTKGGKKRFRKPIKRKKNHRYTYSHFFKSIISASHRNRIASQRYRKSKRLKRFYEKLLTVYKFHLQMLGDKYKSKPLIEYVFRHFKALELYSNLLKDLKMNCKNLASGSGTTMTNRKKRKRTESADTMNLKKSKKIKRQEENLLHILLPNSANRKDAVYAYNFFEKVEEALKSSDRPEEYDKFNQILKSFDPRSDKVADLYHKMENLFLPNHPELAEIFLTFLLPSEAAEVGKFFEHFMYENMSTFINKLNIYFNKQPAQIRKVYNCLSELSEEADVTIEKIKSKIVPLLKGNQFLTDWFLQLFPTEPPPERLFSATEIVNLKEDQMNQTGNYVETITDSLDLTAQEQPQACQLRYINGRIFYGWKTALPAKLSFMVTQFAEDDNTDVDIELPSRDKCVHGIKECGEKQISIAFGGEKEDKQIIDNTTSEENNVKPEEINATEFQSFDVLRCPFPTERSTKCFNEHQSSFNDRINTPMVIVHTKIDSNPNFSPSENKLESSFRDESSITNNEGRSTIFASAKKRKLDGSYEILPLPKRENINEQASFGEDKYDCQSQYDGVKQNDFNSTDTQMRPITPLTEIKTEVSASNTFSTIAPWTRHEDKIILIEMKMNSISTENLVEQLMLKLPNRSREEITDRHQFLIDFVLRLQIS